jgi:hypothetical protein
MADDKGEQANGASEKDPANKAPRKKAAAARVARQQDTPDSDGPKGPAVDAAARLARIADETIKAASDVANDASRKVDVGAYGLGDMVKSLVRLSSVAMTGGLRLAESALGDRPQRPSDGMLVLADHLASIAERTVKHVNDVVGETTPRVADSPMNSGAWLGAAMKLTDIAIIGAVEAVETAVIGPARYAKSEFISDPFTMPDTWKTGTLCVDESSFNRPATNNPVPLDRIRFDPAEVKANKREFRVVVDETGLPSGIYIGTVGIRDGDDGNEIVAGTGISVAIRL